MRRKEVSELRNFALLYVIGTFIIMVCLFAMKGYCQEKPATPEEAAGQEGEEKEDEPLKVPQSPEEKKALQDKKEEESSYDEVVLKDGAKIKGRVEDPGGATIKVKQKLGWVSILKRDIKELHLRSDPYAGEYDDDVVHLKSGKEIRGNAQISPDGKNLTVTVTKDGQKHSVTFPYGDVSRIEWAKERKERFKKLKQFEDPLTGIIEGLLNELSSKEDAVWKAGRDKLVGLGVFAADYLNDRLSELKEPVASRVKNVLKIYSIKSYVSPEAVESLGTGIYEKLISSKKEEKLAMLKKLVLFEEDSAVGLLMHMAKQKDEISQVRNFCLHNLAEKDQNESLVRLMMQAGEKDGWLRLAAALYLADNGVYAGMPHFISALRMRDPGMRELAAEKLRQASGENHGFDAQGTEKEREASIAKWGKWWKEHSAEVMRQSAKVLTSRIPDDDRSFSEVYKKRAHIFWDKEELKKAEESFRKALELNPSNLSARLSLAILLYSEMGKGKEARKEFKLIVKRYSEEAGPMIRKLAFYHTALLDLSESKWENALHNLQSAIVLDGQFADGYIALGKTYYIQAVNDETISRRSLQELPETEREESEQRRKDVIKRSVRALGIGLAFLDKDIRRYMSMDFRQRRRAAERELQERLGTKAEGLTQVEWEASLKKILLQKKARVCSMLADSYALQLDWNKAARYLGDASRLAPDEPGYLCRLGSALAAGGRRKEASEAFERCLKIDPGNETAVRGLEDLK
jgi:tetratricopeptide (TPR) repeat protein